MIEDEYQEEEELEGEEETEEEESQSAREIAEAAWDEQVEAAEQEEGEDLDQEALEGDTEAPAEQPEPIEYPSSWSAELREKMAGLPSDVQKWAAEWSKSQQASFTQKAQELARVRNNINGLVSTIQPYEKQIRAAGETPEQRIGYLLALDERIDTDPIGAIHQLCQECGIHPSQISSGNGQHPQQSAYSHVLPEVENLRQEFQSWQEQQQRREFENMKEGVNSFVQMWASQTDEGGKPMRPYFNDVQNDMVPYINALTQQNPNMPHEQVLQEAYEIAVTRNPKIREIEANRAERAELEEKNRRAKRAKRAGSSVKGSPEISKSSRKYRSTREAAEAAWDQHA